MTEPAELTVALGQRSYRILVGAGLIDRAGALAAPMLAQQRVFIVTDANVAPLHLARLRAGFAAAGIRSDEAVLPPGEATKDFPHLQRLVEAMLDARCERGTTVVALGGGVVGDLAGFAAAILLRGVDFIQVPTTLLAQVDSSVGGKTGINTRHGKNLVGAFHQPRLVLADILALDSLPRRELRAGYAEVVKHGLIADADFFGWLEEHGAAVLDGDAAARREAVLACCRIKARVVAADEREAGQRALLNLGHTFGHALEAESGFGDRLLHGEAVALGLTMAFDLSVRLGLCPAADAGRLRRHLAALGLPVRPRDIAGVDWNADALLAHMASDKKVRDGRVTFVLARGIGQAFLEPSVPAEAVRGVLAAAVEA